MNLLLNVDNFYRAPPFWWSGTPNASACRDLGVYDGYTNLLEPCTGELSKVEFESMISLLAYDTLGLRSYKDALCGSKVTLNEKINLIRSKMKQQDLAVLQKGKRIYVDTNKRLCKRHTADSFLTKKLWDIIHDKIDKTVRIQSNIRIKNVQLDQSHFDILYYEENGKFHRHRDPKEISNMMIPDEQDSYGKSSWVRCTVIIGIASNITPENKIRGDGNTIVYNAEQSTRHLFSNLVIGDNIDHLLFEGDNKILNTHKYLESVQSANFVLFPSGFLHESVAIKQIGGFKLAVKADVLIQLDSKHVYEDTGTIGHYFAGQRTDTCNLFQHIVSNPQKCNCNLCNPQKFASEVMFDILSEVFHNLPLDMVRIITGYVFDASKSENTNLVHNYFTSYTNYSELCTCTECVHNKYVLDDIDILADDEDDYYGHYLPEDLEPEYEISENELDYYDEPEYWVEESDDECNGYLDCDF